MPRFDKTAITRHLGRSDRILFTRTRNAMTTSVVRASRAIADAAARWRDADFPPRVRVTRALRERTGYTEPVIDYALDTLFAEIEASAICATVVSELGSLDALEHFVDRVDRPAVTFAPLERVTIVASDTTIGVALYPLVFALVAGAQVRVKDRDDRLIGAFLETLAQESPELAARASAEPWRGDDDVAAGAHLGDADVVVAFGGDAALVAIRAHLAPKARFIGYGHRTSIGYVTHAALADEAQARIAALGAARDALLYDGEGCLSLHTLFVEDGAAITPHAFTMLLANACDTLAIEFPARSDDYDSDVAAYVRSARFRAAQGDATVVTSALAPHVVVGENDLAIAPPLLRRTIACYPVASPGDALAFLRRHTIALEGLAFSPDAIATPRVDLDAFARASGASRIAPLGMLQRPPLGGEHGGVGRILPFVRAIYRA